MSCACEGEAACEGIRLLASGFPRSVPVPMPNGVGNLVSRGDLLGAGGSDGLWGW
jgi:hypothetical protein